MNTQPLRFASCDQFIEHCAERYRHIHAVDDTIRYGQVIFNELETHRPDLAKQLYGTLNDPFYQNWLFSWTEKWLQQNW